MLETHIICNVYIPTFNVLQTLILVGKNLTNQEKGH